MKEVLKKTQKPWAIPFILLTASSIASADCDLCLTPYLGVDAKIRHMDFQKDFGRTLLKNHYPQTNFFAGLKFNQYVGVEFGYEASKKKFHSVQHDNSNIVFGVPLAQADPPYVPRIDNVTYNSSKISGVNANLVGFLPIDCEDNSLQLIGSIGVSQLKIKTKRTLETTFFDAVFHPDTGDITGFQPTIEHFDTHYKKRKTMLRVTGGVQNMLTDCIGVRALITWENTAKLKAPGIRVSTKERVEGFTKPKNSLSYGLGMFITF